MKSTTSCFGVFNHPAPGRCCSSRIFSGTLSRAETLFTTIEIRLYSSGRKNTLASIGTHDNSRMEFTCRWNRWPSRSALRNRGCLRSFRIGDWGGRSVLSLEVRSRKLATHSTDPTAIATQGRMSRKTSRLAIFRSWPRNRSPGCCEDCKRKAGARRAGQGGE